MKIIRISASELIYQCSLKGNIGSGSQGIVNKYNDDTALKIYYSYIFNAYETLNSNILIDEIEKLKKIECELNRTRGYIERLKQLKILYKKLLVTKSPIIKGVAMCYDFPVGLFLQYYNGYETLSKCFDSLRLSDKKIVLGRVKELIDDLMDHDIYPTDLHLDNIIINKETLSVKLIDLDDYKTKIKSKRYVKKFPLIISQCYKNIKKLEETIN